MAKQLRVLTTLGEDQSLVDPHDDSQLLTTLVSGNPTPFSGFYRFLHPHGKHTYTINANTKNCRKNTFTILAQR